MFFAEPTEFEGAEINIPDTLVDFFKADDDRTYFTQAEVEMPAEQTEPPPLPSSLADHLLAMAPAGDPRFASKRLANQRHAEKLLADIKSGGRID